MTQAQTDLVDKALRKVDALDAPGGAIVGSQGHIYGQLEEASRIILSDPMVPEHLVHALVVDDTTDVNAVLTGNATSITIPLATDFLRVFSFKINDWNKTFRASDVIEDESDETFERYVNGTLDQQSIDAPVAGLVYVLSPSAGFLNTGLKCLPGSGDTDPVDHFYYVPVSAPESIGTPLTEPLLWKAAALIIQPIDPELSMLAEGRYLDALGSRVSRHKNVASRPFRFL